MPYVDVQTIHNPATGLVAPAAWGDGVRANQEFQIDPPQVSVYSSGTVPCDQGVITTLTADGENFDTDAMHSTISNTDRLTAQTPGRYAVLAVVRFPARTDATARLLQFMVNGGTQYNIAQVPSINSATRDTIVSGSRTFTLAAGDYVICRVRHDSATTPMGVSLDEFRAVFDSR